MSAEEASAIKPSLSLADRITKPDATPDKPSDGDGTAPADQAKASTSWADDVASPIAPDSVSDTKVDDAKVDDAKVEDIKVENTKVEDSKVDDKKADDKDSKADSVASAQLDGASVAQNGSNLQEPDYSVEVKLSDVRADPNNPLYSVTSFEDITGLSSDILKGLYLMNFKKPSKIQERALPLLLSDPPTNMIGQSQSGTGKTAAFVLTMLTRVDYSKPDTPQALCLAPTRELARQIMGVVQTMGTFVKGLKVQFAIPQALEKGQKVAAQIVVGTPGTVLDMIKRRTLDASQIKVFVLDEADNMLDQQGLGEQCLRAKHLMPKGAQIVLFSATFPAQVFNFATKFAPNANQLTLKHEELTVEGIRQLYLDCATEQEKYDILVKLYGLMTIGSSIIFVKRRDTASEIERRMTAEGHKVVALHSDLEVSVRDRVIDAFRSGDAKVLITTNVLARGIDVQSVSIVINYDIPEQANGRPDPQTYLHRIGRTGRFGRVGVSISFVYDHRSWSKLQEISAYFGVPIKGVDTRDWDSVEEQVQKVIKSSRAGTNLKME